MTMQRMGILCVFGFVFVLGSCSDSELDAPPLSDEELTGDAPRFVTDSDGRALTFHGVNVSNSAKGDPERTGHMTAADAQRMSGQWGFNFVRYLIFWDAVEPEPGVYDEAYFARVEQRLDWLHEANIVVMLDMHQDVYSQVFCCDGAPEWAVRDDDLAFTQQDLWSANYFQPAVARAFDNFWAYDDGDHADLQDHYADAWAAVAERFGDHPAVIGYDVMNEPYPGSDMDIVELSGQANPNGSLARFAANKLAPFYQRVINRIREVDTERWIFFEPHYGTVGLGNPSYLPVLVDPRVGEDRLVYAPHLYSLRYEATMRYTESDPTVERWERETGNQAALQRSPLLLGEWGLDWNGEGSAKYMQDVVEAADRLMAGWAYWSFDGGSWSFWQFDTESESPSVEYVVRAYPQRVAGRPTSFFYDRDSRVFTLSFDSIEGVTAPTEIYIPAARYYADGYELSVDGPADSWSSEWDAEREVLRLTTDPAVETWSVQIAPVAD